MSIDLDWQTLTSGPEGQDLANSIRDFIHEKFQQVALPRFIRSVHVHTFDFGKESPVIELKDISDPLPQFYEGEDGASEDGEEEKEEHEERKGDDKGGNLQDGVVLTDGRSAGSLPKQGVHTTLDGSPQSSKPQTLLERRMQPLQTHFSLAEHLASPMTGATTPGILGSTSNINSYFNLPLSAGLSRAQTPLAAVASGTSLNQYINKTRHGTSQHRLGEAVHDDGVDFPSRPSTATEEANGHARPSTKGSGDIASPSQNAVPSPFDTQITLHISYTGSLSLILTAEISLDYPLPSLVGIPVKLSITGLSFDGVALLAYLHSKKANFCFLGEEDAQVLLEAEQSGLSGSEDGFVSASNAGSSSGIDKLGGLLKEMKIESEIGRMENGRQALKNVGKVERFVLEQVRRIFEEELVWPSWWTFLV